MDYTVYAGTVGWGVWRSDDGGRDWRFAFEGLSVECRVWSLSCHSAQPGVVWAGTDNGLLRQEPNGRGRRIHSPADDKQIWAIHQDGTDPEEIVIGTNPGKLYKSVDGGRNWDELPIDLVDECPIGKPRITRIRQDPIDLDTLWVSAEIDAVHRSRDRGKTWERSEEGFKFPDIHDIAIASIEGSRKLLAATALGLYISEDDGSSWHWQELNSPWQYTRGLKPKSNLDGTVFICNGDGPPGTKGRLLRSRDWGQTWADAHLPGPTNSTPWMVATNEADCDLMFCCTNLGQMFKSSDGGETWVKLPREFGEIRTMLWQPIN